MGKGTVINGLGCAKPLKRVGLDFKWTNANQGALWTQIANDKCFIILDLNDIG
jgi:hypothetical protein